MWKKKDSERPAPAPDPVSGPEPPASRPAATQRRTERAVIGPTLKIKGEISGEEDLLIQGQIDGKITVTGQSVTIGKAGRIEADVHARSIHVEGKVRGDLHGAQEVIIAASGDVEGNLVAPSVRLENGSRFKGSIDMESAQSTTPIPPTTPQPGSATPDRKQPTSPPSPDSGQPPRRP